MTPAKFSCSSHEQQNVVSLSTIPPRFSGVGKTLISLLNQKIVPDRIELFIPKAYRRFPQHAFCLPDVPEGVTLEVVDTDFGPATKVLPAARKYRDSNTRIAYCDDDRLYSANWLAQLIELSIDHSSDCVAFRGRDIDDQTVTGRIISRNSTAQPPRVKHRSGGITNLPQNIPYWIIRQAMRWRHSAKGRDNRSVIWGLESGYADIAEGAGGVMIHPKMFDDAAFDIPEMIWSVDDVWLSGCLARKGIKIWIGIPLLQRMKFPITQHSEGLENSKINGMRRLEANRVGIEYFQKNYRVW